jgi:hypothetical protein
MAVFKAKAQNGPRFVGPLDFGIINKFKNLAEVDLADIDILKALPFNDKAERLERKPKGPRILGPNH